jgi:hypothetical protein
MAVADDKAGPVRFRNGIVAEGTGIETTPLGE